MRSRLTSSSSRSTMAAMTSSAPTDLLLADGDCVHDRLLRKGQSGREAQWLVVEAAQRDAGEPRRGGEQEQVLREVAGLEQGHAIRLLPVLAERGPGEVHEEIDEQAGPLDAVGAQHPIDARCLLDRLLGRGEPDQPMAEELIEIDTR